MPSDGNLIIADAEFANLAQGIDETAEYLRLASERVRTCLTGAFCEAFRSDAMAAAAEDASEGIHAAMSAVPDAVANLYVEVESYIAEIDEIDTFLY